MGDPVRVYWETVGLVLVQLEGLAAGYANSTTGKTNPLSLTDLLLINLSGDMEDLAGAVGELHLQPT